MNPSLSEGAAGNKFQTPLGMKDILPEEIPLFRLIEEKARTVFETFGYSEIRTPILEQTELFSRGIGEVTDIVEKEMFTMPEEGLTLRPEGTAAVVRSYVEHAMHKEKSFRKFYYAGPFFRKERPQKGRLRQFHQVGLEAIGSDDPLLDAEIITAASAFLAAVGIEGSTVRLNSIGCSACRDGYRQVLRDALSPKLQSLCENCRKRFDRNVFRVLDCKQENCRAVRAGAPAFSDSLCAACAAHLAEVRNALGSSGVKYVIDPHLVRGFDYYTRTVFEISHEGLGAQNAVAAGGRYDGLVQELGGPPLPGVGFSAGCERIALLIEKSQPAAAVRPIAVTVVYVQKEQKAEAFSLLSFLRSQGISSDMSYESKSVKAQMRLAERSGSGFAAVLGPDEAARGRVRLKNMATGEEVEVERGEIPARVPHSV